MTLQIQPPAPATRAVKDDDCKLILSLVSDYAYAFRLEPDGNFVRVWTTDGFQRVTGFEPEEFDRRGWDQLFHPDDRHVMQRRIAALRAGKDDVCEYRIVTKSGQTRWVRGYARPIREEGSDAVLAFCAAQDITDRKLAEQALQTLNETLEQRVAERTAHAEHHTRILKSMLDSIGDGVVVCDASGKFLLWNPAALQIVGKGLADVPAESWSDYYGIYRPDRLTPYPVQDLPLARAMRGDAVDDCELFIRNELKPDGVWIHATARPFHDESGAIAGGVVVFHDITQDKQRTEMLLQSERRASELAEHNRRLVQEVDHRVRNNLAGLLGWISLMRHKAVGLDVDTFARAAQSRLSAMAHVHEILAEGGWRAVDLRGLIRTTLQTMAHLAPHAAALELDGPPVSLGAAQALPLTMVLVELFTNSCKYGAHAVPGGAVSIQWSASASASGASPDVTLVRLTWTERGGPPIARQPEPSLGTKLVEGFVTRELRGRCTLRFPRTGAAHEIEFDARADA